LTAASSEAGYSAYNAAAGGRIHSGNTDFTNADNSLLVDYELIRVGPDCEPYDPDQIWADPSVEQAAQHMLNVAASLDLRLRIARAASEFVKTTLSPEAIGRMMRQRLQVLSLPARGLLRGPAAAGSLQDGVA